MHQSLLKCGKWLKKIAIFILLIGIIYQGCAIVLSTPRVGSHSAHFPYESFIFVEVGINFLEETASSSESSSIGSSGSGMSIGTTRTGNTAILTAYHVCNPAIITTAVILLGENAVRTTEVTDFFGNKARARMILSDIENDLCILEAPGLRVPGVPISQRLPLIGDKVYNVAAPQAFFMPGMVPLLSGYYSGNIDIFNGPDSVYTIPASQGSSGSAILNSDGKIIGVIHSALRDYSHVAICSTHQELISFISRFTNSLGGRLVH